MPKVSCNTLSPRRLINEQINLIPYTASNTLQGRPARYNINRSPSKVLLFIFIFFFKFKSVSHLICKIF